MCLINSRLHVPRLEDNSDTSSKWPHIDIAWRYVPTKNRSQIILILKNSIISIGTAISEIIFHKLIKVFAIFIRGVTKGTFVGLPKSLYLAISYVGYILYMKFIGK